MARIRTIKPEFWTSDQTTEVSLQARLTFIGMWNFCDDTGLHKASTNLVKRELFPDDNLTKFEIEGWLNELLDVGLLEHGWDEQGTALWRVTGWHHQKIDHPSKSKFNGFTTVHPEDRKPREDSRGLARTSEGSRLKGRERSKSKSKSKTRSILSVSRTVTDMSRDTSETPADMSQHTNGIDFDRLKTVYPKRGGSQPWKRAMKAANARMEEGHTFEAMLAGTQRYARYCEVTDKVGTEFVMMASTFLGPDKHFENPWEPPKPPKPPGPEDPETQMRRLRDEGRI